MNDSLLLSYIQRLCVLTLTSDFIIIMPSQTHGPMSLLPKCWFLCLIEVFPPRTAGLGMLLHWWRPEAEGAW